MQRLEPSRTALVIVDVQEKLAPAMPSERQAALVRNTLILLEAARLLGVRVLATEQYPKGLGPTVSPIREKLVELGVSPIEKMTFDAGGEPAFARALAAVDPAAVVVVGMETHICVLLSARELVRRGFATHVVADAVASRTDERRAIGLGQCERAGAVITTAETVVFDWLERAGTDAFRTLSKLVR